MGLSYIYKKFSTQDIAKVPFNAHKQYNYTSASAASNQIAHYNTSYTSESISLYSSASSTYGGDTINVIKYNQIDHLFYRNHLKKVEHKKDFINFLNNRKDLYEKTNILSIPSGLYGAQIKKSSFYLSSSTYEIIDDSKGNLIISGTDTSAYPNDVQKNIFRLDPIKGFEKYDLDLYDGYAEVTKGDELNSHLIINKRFYRKGLINTSAPKTYTSDTKGIKEYFLQDEDDSYYFNELNYNNVTFKASTLGDVCKFSSITFNSETGSFIKTPHNKRLNFHTNQDFSISFYITPDLTGSLTSQKRYIIAKSGTETIVSSGSEFKDIEAQSSQFPYEIYMISQSLFFERSDGSTKNVISGEITASGTAERTSHILCQLSSSVMELWFDGTKIASGNNTLKKPTRNNCNLYIGSRGTKTTSDTGSDNTKYFNGDLGNINIWSNAYTSDQIANISESVNASPYIGNIFYKSGLATITHPKYLDALSGSVENTGGINTLQFQGTHLIYEHEYQCSIQEHEFNTTLNGSALDKTDINPYKIANFTTSSHFQPFITTIGLYNEENELLVIGKLGQPIRKSDKTDMTFVIRWDS